MWNRNNHQILFVPGSDFTDPSYHLPHFYELFALWAYKEDRKFWEQAAVESRRYLVRACHEKTGFSAEYTEFDGSPMCRKLPWTNDRHDWFYSDSYRTVANIGLDYEWFGKDEGQCHAAQAIQEFLLEDCRKNTYHIYEIDGSVAKEWALHPVAIPATVAMSTLVEPLNVVKNGLRISGICLCAQEREDITTIAYISLPFWRLVVIIESGNFGVC